MNLSLYSAFVSFLSFFFLRPMRYWRQHFLAKNVSGSSYSLLQMKGVFIRAYKHSFEDVTSHGMLVDLRCALDTHISWLHLKPTSMSKLTWLTCQSTFLYDLRIIIPRWGEYIRCYKSSLRIRISLQCFFYLCKKEQRVTIFEYMHCLCISGLQFLWQSTHCSSGKSESWP